MSTGAVIIIILILGPVAIYALAMFWIGVISGAIEFRIFDRLENSSETVTVPRRLLEKGWKFRTIQDKTCPVCGVRINGQLCVECMECRTPCHIGCRKYMKGRCSTYGCRNAVRQKTKLKSHAPGVEKG